MQPIPSTVIVFSLIALISGGVGCEGEKFACIHNSSVGIFCTAEEMSEDNPCECNYDGGCMYSETRTCEDYGFAQREGDRDDWYNDASNFDESEFEANLSRNEHFPKDTSGSPGGSYLLTCDAKDATTMCIHYTFTSEDERDSFSAQCAYRQTNSHTCPSGGVGCRHTTSTRTADTFVYGDDPARVKAICLEEQGTPL